MQPPPRHNNPAPPPPPTPLPPPQMFDMVTGWKAHVNIVDWGISNATLEDVFVRFCNGSYREQRGGPVTQGGPGRDKQKHTPKTYHTAHRSTPPRRV